MVVIFGHMLNLGFLFGISMAKNSNIIFASVDLYNSFWKFDEKRLRLCKYGG